MGIKTKDVLKRIGDLEREIEYIKRDLMDLEEKTKQKPSLFGSVSDDYGIATGESHLAHEFGDFASDTKLVASELKNKGGLR